MPAAKYTTEQRQHFIEVVASENGNLSAAERILSVPRSTLAYILRQAGVRGGTRPDGSTRTGTAEDVAELREKYRKAANKTADMLLDPKKLEKASLKDAALASAIAVDKFRLLGGQSSLITEQQRVTYSYIVPGHGLRELAVRALAGDESAFGSAGYAINAPAIDVDAKEISPAVHPLDSNLGKIEPES